MRSKHELVKVGGLSTTLWKAGDGRWKWHAHRGGLRVLCAAKNIDDARTKAREQLKDLRKAKSHLEEASPKVLSQFHVWLAARIDSPKLADGAKKYLAHLASRKVKETRIIAMDLANFSEGRRSRMSDITPADVAEYLDGLAVGPRRYNNVRSNLAGWFRWARAVGLVPDATTAPERVVPRKTENAPVAIYTPDEFGEILLLSDEFQLAVAIGGLAGLRSEEIYGLRWEDLKPEHIEVRADTAKTGNRRLVPIQPSLKTWIAASQPQDGNMVAPRLTFSVLQKRLKKRYGIKWVHNGLRHSFGTYRCGVTKNIAEVSYEMGNSPAMVKRHYLEMQDEASGRSWFETTYSQVTSK